MQGVCRGFRLGLADLQAFFGGEIGHFALDTEEVAIAGAEVISDQQIKPIIWKISLPEDKMETEFYTDTITANVEAIRQGRFSQVQFKKVVLAGEWL